MTTVKYKISEGSIPIFSNGACGTAFGFGQSRLLLAANVNQIMKLGFDDAHDVFNIKRGIQIYNNR